MAVSRSMTRASLSSAADMTPADLKAARKELGLSQAEFARVVGVASDRTVRKWEDAERDIPGPVIVLVGLMLEMPAVRRALIAE
ncbi:MAG: helix-turn-helix domain-containing protein [Pseudomonadota bacterium]|nr:helix-turn-helix domain-containing protein [Pseudomonadota bacterium]